MKSSFHLPIKAFLLLIVLSSAALTSVAQLKVGDNPHAIQQSAILELESTRQGLLLPRLADTAAINSLNPPDGMIVYLNTDRSLRLRSNGHWKKIADLSEAESNWSKSGNSGTDPATHFLGTVDGKPLVIRTDNAERMRIDETGNVGIGTTSPTAKLNVDGTVKFENLAAGTTTELEVLVVANDGSVLRRTMSSSAFENAIKAINGLQKQTLSITAETSTTKDAVEVENRASDSTIALYLPVQDGSSASKPYGFLTKADWDKIQSAVQTITIGAVAGASDVKGASISNSGTGWEIVLHPADATNAGVVTAGTQTFGGDKTFDGNTTLNGTLALYSLADNATADSVLVLNNGVLEKRQVSAAAFNDAVRSLNGNSEVAQTIAFTTTGTDLNVSTANNNTINLNVPDAAVAARGVVNTAAQSFAGEKTFQDNVVAATSIKVGGAGTANSTMQVAGSLSYAVRTVSANATLGDGDHTLLVNTTSGAVTVTLPAAAAITGRTYTIKKIGTGGIDNVLTINPGGATIEGGNTYLIYNDWTFITIQTDGTNWYIIRK